MRTSSKNIFVLFSAFISIVLLIVARHHPPSRRKIKEIWHGRVYWERESNTTMLRSSPEKALEQVEPKEVNEISTNLGSIGSPPKIQSEESDKAQKMVVKPMIAICAATHSKSNWRSLDDTALRNLLIPSIQRTISPADRSQYDFRLYLAADHDDQFWLNNQNNVKTPDWLSVHVGFYDVPEHKIPFNPMMRAAYNDGAEYMVRINDDSEFMTPDWVSKATAKLATYDPPNVGMVGPNCREGNTDIMTHDMVHRTHLDIFEHYYPNVFSAWWVDGWISKVYGPQRSTKMMDWTVKHHIHKHGTRYEVQHHEKQLLKGELEKGRERIESWLVTRSSIVGVSVKQTVVMAAAMNYGLSEFKNFVIPLRKVYTGDVILFVNANLPPDVVKLCQQHNIITRALPTGSRLGVKGNRYIGYSEVCNNYQWCFATDFRDVFFQENPFLKLPNADLILFKEDNHVKLGYRKDRPMCTPTVSIPCTCPYNANWIRTCWGNEFLSSITDESPICSGTIMGTPRGFDVLKDKMLAEMTATASKDGCTARDQGHLNYLYFANHLDVPTIVQSRGEGIVNTVGYITPRNTINDHLKGGYVVNKDNKVSAVVHQYDRFPELNALLRELVHWKKLINTPLATPNQDTPNNDYVTNKKYIDMCTVSYKTRSKNDFRLPLTPNSIVCVKGDTATLTSFFQLNIRQPFTLVTIEMDDAVPQNALWLNHKYLKKWYSWNSKHSDVIPIPIGLNEDSQLNPMQQVTPVTPKIEMALVNFKQDRPVRVSLFNKVKDLSYVHVESYSQKWQNTQKLSAHYESISKYKWTLCPRGAGQDTHRLWEALYLGSIPVVLKSSISPLYEGLPVIQLNSWDELSLDMLKERSKSLPDDRTNAYFKHWENMIRSPINKIDLPPPSLNRVISYSLYGSNPRYTDGTLANAKLIKEIYPDWSMRVYYDNTVPRKVIEQLRDEGVQLVDMTGSEMNKRSWRFQAAADTERFCSRDVDSRLSKREAAAVQEWIQSGKQFHVMRDHPSHSKYVMSSGMWCSTTIPNIKKILVANTEKCYICDQNWLKNNIWPMAQKSLLQHDSFSCDKFGGGKPFPTPRVGWEHVGSVYINGKMRQGDVDILKQTDVIQNCTPSKQTLCIGIVAYQGVKTLENTLQSYRTHELYKYVHEAHILFQKLDAPERRAWAEDVIQRYPELIPIYETKNIQNEAFFKLIKACSKSEFVMIVEEDFQISNKVKDLKIELENGLYMLNHGANAVRMRSRNDGGLPNYSKEGIVKTGKIIKTHTISHVMVDDHAENSHPEISVCRKEPKTWCTSSKYGHYTNNPVLYRVSFANEIFKQVPQDMRSFSKFEPWMTNWWSTQDFVLAWSNGIFKHNRLDRTFGLKSVPSQNKDVPQLLNISPKEKKCNDVFVSAFFDMGNFRDSRQTYAKATALLVNKITSFGCEFHFFCGTMSSTEKADCSDIYQEIGNNPLVHRWDNIAMDDLMIEISLTKTNVIDSLNHMGHVLRNKNMNPSNSAILKYPKERMIDYLRINMAKFVILNHVAKKMSGTCITGQCLVWVDAGIYRHESSTEGFAEKSALSLVRTNTAVLSASGTNWPKMFQSVYLYGGRDEVAAGVMIFDSAWFMSTFFKSFKTLLNKIVKKGEITTDQGMLTLLVQQFPHARILKPSYSRILERMLTGGSNLDKDEIAFVFDNPSDQGDRAAQVRRWAVARDTAFRAGVYHLERITKSMGLEWTLRGGSVIGPARYGAWDYVSDDVVNFVDWDLDSGILFESIAEKEQKCPRILEQLSEALKSIHPNGKIETYGSTKQCRFGWKINKGLGLDPVRQADVTYGALIHFGVDPMIKYTTAHGNCANTKTSTFCWCHQDGTYCIDDTVLRPLVSYYMPPLRGNYPTHLKLPRDISKITDAYERRNGNPTSNCAAVPYYPVAASIFYRDFANFERKYAHKGIFDPEMHTCSYLQKIYTYAKSSKEQGNPNFWHAWMSDSCKAVRHRVESKCSGKPLDIISITPPKIRACRAEAALWLEKNKEVESLRCVKPFSELQARVSKMSPKISVGVDSGPLLGWYRQCSCIPYSQDIDVVINWEDIRVLGKKTWTKLGSVDYIDKSEQYPRCIKTSAGGMHVDMIVVYSSAHYNLTWAVGDPHTIEKMWDPRDYDIAYLHNIPLRIPRQPLKHIKELYCDAWEERQSDWESVPLKFTDKKGRFDRLGMCNIVDVLDTKINDIDWTLVNPSDPLRDILNMHGKCYNSNDRLNCLNKYYVGPRGGAKSAFKIPIK